MLPLHVAGWAGASVEVADVLLAALPAAAHARTPEGMDSRGEPYYL